MKELCPSLISLSELQLYLEAFKLDPPWNDAKETILWCREYGVTLCRSNALPTLLLAECPKLAPFLFLKGRVELVAEPSLAIVGTRRPSSYGARAAMTLSRNLAERGLTIVSGLARGIDSLAHRGAIQAKGKTIAVLGHGLNRIYPPENEKLANEIVGTGGLLVSEYPPGVHPAPMNFPARNRIIAALSLGTIVIEAGENSGSLITARRAVELNREVFVVPGPYDHSNFFGSHRLLQQGAKLVVTVEDVLEEFCRLFSSEGEVIDAKTVPSEARQLESLFRPFGGSATLEELFSSSTLSLFELIESLEKAKEEGWVLELHPQNFVWVQCAESDVRGETCQTDFFSEQ